MYSWTLILTVKIKFTRQYNKLVSIQKREFLVKVKEREDCNHRNTLEYFEDYNLKRDAACPAKALATAEDWPKGPFMDGH